MVVFKDAMPKKSGYMFCHQVFRQGEYTLWIIWPFSCMLRVVQCMCSTNIAR